MRYDLSQPPEDGALSDDTLYHSCSILLLFGPAGLALRSCLLATTTLLDDSHGSLILSDGSLERNQNSLAS